MRMQACRHAEAWRPPLCQTLGQRRRASGDPRVPRRAGALAVGPARREDVLDRYACQTAICPGTAAAHRRARAARGLLGAAAVVGAAALAAGAAVGLDRGALLRCARA